MQTQIERQRNLMHRIIRRYEQRGIVKDQSPIYRAAQCKSARLEEKQGKIVWHFVQRMVINPSAGTTTMARLILIRFTTE